MLSTIRAGLVGGALVTAAPASYLLTGSAQVGCYPSGDKPSVQLKTEDLTTILHCDADSVTADAGVTASDESISAVLTVGLIEQSPSDFSLATAKLAVRWQTTLIALGDSISIAYGADAGSSLYLGPVWLDGELINVRLSPSGDPMDYRTDVATTRGAPFTLDVVIFGEVSRCCEATANGQLRLNVSGAGLPPEANTLRAFKASLDAGAEESPVDVANPEPSTVVLMLTGIALAAFRKR